jgi:hypothetical protein
MTKCTLCRDIGWVCERHPQLPWDGPKACGCGAPGPRARPAMRQHSDPLMSQWASIPIVEKLYCFVAEEFFDYGLYWARTLAKSS